MCTDYSVVGKLTLINADGGHAIKCTDNCVTNIADELTMINAGDWSTRYMYHIRSIMIANKFTVADAHVCVPNIQKMAFTMASIMDSVVGECAVSDGHVSITYTNYCVIIYIANKFTVAEAHVSVPNIQNDSNVVGEHAVSDG